MSTHKELDMASKSAKLMVAELGEKGHSTAHAIAAAMAPGLYASIKADALAARCTELEARLAAIEAKARP